ncbi:MAG TPA: tetratricopeptide repeat protein [Vicinamibacterales bacterium]|nr:tetratricopeptide repeat protein [Vicinamibacterales bacterium]
MRPFRILTALVMALVLSVGVFAQSRGPLRLKGKVVDAAGQPVEGADVRAAKKGEAAPEVFSAKTNKKGEFTLGGIAAGQWVIEVMKEGIGVTEVTQAITEADKNNILSITLVKPAPAPVDPSIEINAEHSRAIALAQANKFTEARAIYEALLVKFPTIYQLHAMLGTMYAAENNAAKALEHVKIALEKEPANVDWQMLAAELIMESGDKAGAQKILDTVDITKVKDPRAFVNSAINKINSGDKAQAEQATELLTKLIAQFPSEPMYLYLRARSYLATAKLVEARADLEKYVATAPATAVQMADAKKLLEQLNKK